MSLEFIRIIRELTDTGSLPHVSSQTFCFSESEVSDLALWEPNTDIFESEEEVFIRIELAGVKREDLSVRLKSGKLCVLGIRKENRPDKQLHFHQLELNYGPFEKVILIPSDIEHNDISAHLVDGLLEIVISKTSRVIEIPIAEEIAGDPE
jgi:HSP20 family protein